MAAERHFAAGGEPAQHPLPIELQQEGRFRLAQAGGQGLHPGVGGRPLQGNHRGAIAREGAAAEGFDQHRSQQPRPVAGWRLGLI